MQAFDSLARPQVTQGTTDPPTRAAPTPWRESPKVTTDLLPRLALQMRSVPDHTTRALDPAHWPRSQSGSCIGDYFRGCPAGRTGARRAESYVENRGSFRRATSISLVITPRRIVHNEWLSIETPQNGSLAWDADLLRRLSRHNCLSNHPRMQGFSRGTSSKAFLACWRQLRGLDRRPRSGSTTWTSACTAQ